MQQADQELAALNHEKKVKASANNVQDSALHSEIDSNLRSLMKQAKKTGVDISSVDQDFKAVSSSAATKSSQSSSSFSNNQHFTSFPKASLASVQQAKGDATLLDDGALIKDPNAPVARIAIPLGAHQDAKEDRKLGRTWKNLRRAPKATIQDKSTEASAVRADGSHNTMEKLRMPQGRITNFNKLPVSVHMPHLQ
ncbi:hypothetical protein GUITHDRAFT_152919 [Guillardia theta CCMP2712]|uniref:Uncharacterized protein n=1 Tax=Guillardia theta (strain CCMP2712) TaxID=905079 RepID=L1J7V0_GUITC|nr:hypothetical protein GUITHDRAFT_152919 [Guillardia theta CCMP2712]EKX44613.1 hypothetical protein GUITHDRAFT_152919 [Guillardia theta CCMP2712]|eukprot:XP_005831593.1 hypothetical protein GUITHDRAFT_152919 [Guillardia theta CCMP2712]